MKAVFCVMICLALLLSPFPQSSQGEGASPAVAPIIIYVRSIEGTPIVNAYVSLWDHSAVPSRQVSDTITDAKGLATFTMTSLDFTDKSGELDQHLAVMVTAAGHETGHMSWSVQRMEKDAEGKLTALARVDSPDITVELEVMPREQNEPEAVAIKSSWLIRHRLEWQDNNSYRNQLTLMAILHQTGHVQSQFQYAHGQQVQLEVKAKGTLGGWSGSGYVRRTNTLNRTIGWNLPATGNNSQYWVNWCQTQFDYRLEQYAIEQQNPETGLWERIGTEHKFYAVGLNNTATNDGSTFQIGAPPYSGVTWTGNMLRNGHVTYEKSQGNVFGAALSLNVIGVPCEVGLNYNVTTSAKWTFTNNTNNKYEIGVRSSDQVYFFRYVP